MSWFFRVRILSVSKGRFWGKIDKERDGFVMKAGRSMKHNKLVRDKIPGLIISRGDKPITQILGADAYRQELRRKLHEEDGEFFASGKLEELADILEVVYALAVAEGVSQFQLEEIRKRKRRERGGFDQRIFLVETSPADVV